jgi:GT2 family glycosyltransferase
VALYQQTTGFGQESNVRDKGFSATANLFCTRQQFEIIGPFDTRLLSGGDREWCWRASLRSFHVHYEPTAVVHTQPRTDLRGAIRQSRRVVAGRKMLRELRLGHRGDESIAKLRSPLQAALWILRYRDLTLWNRLQVLLVAILIRAAAQWESVRLTLGAKAERR